MIRQDHLGEFISVPSSACFKSSWSQLHGGKAKHWVISIALWSSPPHAAVSKDALDFYRNLHTDRAYEICIFIHFDTTLCNVPYVNWHVTPACRIWFLKSKLLMPIIINSLLSVFLSGYRVSLWLYWLVLLQHDLNLLICACCYKLFVQKCSC